MFFLCQSLSATAKAEFVQVAILIWHRMAVLCTVCQHGIPTLSAIVCCQCFVIIKYILYSEEMTTNSFHFEAEGHSLLTIMIFSDHQVS